MGSLPAGTGWSGRLLVEVSVMSVAPLLPEAPRLQCGSTVAIPGVGVARPADGDGSGPSVGGGIPCRSDADAHLQRDAQADRGGHALPHERAHLSGLAREHLDHEFIVHLQQQP